MKKVLSLIIALTLVVTCFCLCASATEAVAPKSVSFYSEGDVIVPVPQGGGSIDSLIDGTALLDITTWQVNGVVIFQNTHCENAGEYPEFSIIVELEDIASISGVAVTFYEHYNAMIGLPKDSVVTVEYSEDGDIYYLVDDFTTDAVAQETVNKGETAEIVFDEAVEGKFVKFTFTYGDSPFTTDSKVIWEWIGLSELEVYASAIDDEPIINVSSEAPSEKPVTSSEKPTTDTSDNGMVALVVVAVLAVAGAVVVKKTR